MNADVKEERRKLKHAEIRALVDNAHEKCEKFFQDNYQYCDSEAIDELGLDSDLIDQLVEDYVIQIIKSSVYFKEYLARLQAEKKSNKELNYTAFKELAHKNLGVVRNLRIKDSEKILTTLMKSDDLDELEINLEILEACAIKLKPISAYAALELIKIKSKLS